MIPVEQLNSLLMTDCATITEEYLDEMGHMNVQYYMRIYNRAAWGMFDHLGITLEYLESERGGMFALKHFIEYLAEVRAGETVTVWTRLLGVSAKRLHFMHFMVNNTTGRVASTMEVLASYADLHTRRTAPFPPEMAGRIRVQVEAHNRLDWNAPVCGLMQG